ncbi:MAG: tail fiber domain-containing protein [Patescibacteria group bacterium]
MNQFSKFKNGFSLIELLIYVSIFAVVAGLMTSILITILKVSQKESASVETSEQLSFVMQTVSRLIRESSNIEIASANSLKLRMKDSSKDPTCLYLENQTIKLAEGPDSSNLENCDLTSASNLTSSKVIADKLDFSKISNYPGHDVVSIDIQLTYNSNNPQSQTTRALRSAIARVSAATFDSDLLPGSDNQYDLGFSPNTEWRDAAFSRNLSVGGNVGINGNVGIGTTGPVGKLDIYDTNKTLASSNTNVFIVTTDTQAADIGGSISFAGNTVGTGSPVPFGYIWGRKENNTSGNELGYLAFGTRTSGTANERMRITSGGNVGIGTTNPGAKLDIQASAANSTHLLMYNAAGSSGSDSVWFRDTDTTAHRIFRVTGDYDTDAGGPFEFVINQSGNVGIGETNPLQKLVVYGNGDGNSGITVKSPYGFRTSYFASDGSLNFNNGTNVGFLNSAGAWIDGSDVAYKKNIQDIKYGLNDVLRMRPRAYLMKDTNISQIGFIAQEMREIIPEAVSGMEGNLGISYGQLTSVLAKAIQEQQNQIEELKAEVEKLKAN